MSEHLTDDELSALEKKWEQQFDGHEVCRLIGEVRRLRLRVLTYEPLDGSCCVPAIESSPELAKAYAAAHECGCHWPGNHRDPDVEGHAV
jgi:hypothetical protein